VSAAAGGLVDVDTTTGRCWLKEDREKWEELGSPVEQKK
jgi:hypothetical protein